MNPKACPSNESANILLYSAHLEITYRELLTRSWKLSRRYHVVPPPLLRVSLKSRTISKKLQKLRDPGGSRRKPGKLIFEVVPPGVGFRTIVEPSGEACALFAKFNHIFVGGGRIIIEHSAGA